MSKRTYRVGRFYYENYENLYYRYKTYSYLQKSTYQKERVETYFFIQRTPEDGQTDADADDGWVAAVARAPCEGVKCEDKSGRMGSCATALMAALLCVGFVSGGNPDAKRLYDDLLSNYNKLVRPVVNVSEAVTVRLKLKLSQLIDVVSE